MSKIHSANDALERALIRDLPFKTKLPVWQLERKLLHAEQAFVKAEEQYRKAERAMWAARREIEARRHED